MVKFNPFLSFLTKIMLCLSLVLTVAAPKSMIRGHVPCEKLLTPKETAIRRRAHQAAGLDL